MAFLALMTAVGAASAQSLPPARIGGTLTVNGQQVTQSNDPGYIFVVTRMDSTPYNPPAEDTDGLTSNNLYLINIPIKEAGTPGGAEPGETALLNVSINGERILISSPAEGKFTVGANGSITPVNIQGTRSGGGNQAPSADAGADQTVSPRATVYLDGAGSSDPDSGDVLTYRWTQVFGVSVTLSDDTAIAPTFTAPDVASGEETTLAFQLEVTDGDGLKDTDSVSIVVRGTTENLPPVANAGPDQTVAEGDFVTLDGSNSTDPDNGPGNGIQTYSWEQQSGTSVALSSTTVSQPTFTAPDVGPAGEALVFQLTVSDKAGATGIDTTTVNVTAANRPPVAVAGPNQTVGAGETVALDGSDSYDPDDGDSIAAYKWRQVGGIDVILSDTASARPTFTAPSAGTSGRSLLFELMVTDNGGLQHSDRTVVNVVPAGSMPPVADAGPDQTVAEGANVTLDGTGSNDPDGMILFHIWSQVGGTAVTLSDAKIARPTFFAPNVGPGNEILTFELTVVDDTGLADTDRVLVQVTFVGRSPVADAGPDQTASPGSTVRLDGSGSGDPDGQIVSYSWGQVRGAPVSLSDATAIRPVFTAPAASGGDTLVFELTVVDNDGLGATDRTTVMIPSAGDGPTADAGEDRIVEEGRSGILNGAGSFSTSDRIVAYFWRQTAGPGVKIEDSGAPKTTFFAPSVDADTLLLFELKVTDSMGRVDTDTVTMTVKDFGKGPGDEGGSCFIGTVMPSGNSMD